ncbi:beta-ketoacyl synthase chain length factor [Glycomyces paridis]|nr:beta-ketoacyl synthase chain length factor [Glycomyces paridis]
MRIAGRTALPARPDGGPAEHGPHLPPPGVLRVPGLDIAAAAGPKGIRSMDRATALAVAATGRLLAAAPGTDRARTAILLASASGSFATAMRLGADSVTKPRPYQIDPGAFPVAVMNYGSGQCAIRHRVTGPNTALRGGRIAFAQALRHARRLLAAGRADQVLCGAAEEATPERAWLEHAARPADAEPVPVGEGCALFRLVLDDAPGPRVTGVATARGHDPAAALTTAIRNALNESGLPRAAVTAVAATAGPDGNGPAERDAIRTALGDPAKLRHAHRTGDTGAATLGFALAAALDATAPGTCFALTAIDRTGTAACVIGRNA